MTHRLRHVGRSARFDPPARLRRSLRSALLVGVGLAGSLAIGTPFALAWQSTGRAAEPFATLEPQPAAVPRSAYYRSCADARGAGAAPLRRGEPGYRAGLDADGDGIACEPYRGKGGVPGRSRRRRS